MVAACQAFGLQSTDEVLTPAYDCDGSLQPFRIFNLNLVFFRINPYTLEVDISDLKKKISNKTKLIHIINYFGVPQPWSNLLSLRNEFEIPILEDNAYSLFSSYQNKALGTFGDISIFSLRKNLPLIDGGLLRINNPKYKFQAPIKSARWAYISQFPEILRFIKYKMGLKKIPLSIQKIIKKNYAHIEPPPSLYSAPESGYPDWPQRDHIPPSFLKDTLRPMSKFARFQLSQWKPKNFDDIIQKKKKYYAQCVKALYPIKGIKILWPELPEQTVPFCISFLVDKNRDALFYRLRKKYEVMVWPTLPQIVLDELKKFPEVEMLGRKLLQFNLSVENISRRNFHIHIENFIRDLRL